MPGVIASPTPPIDDSRYATLLGVVFVLGEDAQPVVDTQRAQCANEDVRSTTVHARH